MEEKKWTSIVISKEQRKQLDLIVRKLGLRTFKELFDKIIEENKDKI